MSEELKAALSEYLSSVKEAIRLMTDAFDNQLIGLMAAALADLGIAGVNGEAVVISDPLVLQAVITYVQLHFGEPTDYDRLKASYDEQKAQLSMATGYTVFEVS